MTDEKTDEKAPPSRRDKAGAALALVAGGAALLYAIVAGEPLHVCECPEVVVEVVAPVGIDPEVPDPEAVAHVPAEVPEHLPTADEIPAP